MVGMIGDGGACEVVDVGSSVGDESMGMRSAP